MTSCNPHAPASTAGQDDRSDSPANGPQVPVARCVLVVTRLAPGVSALVVADIFKRCRERYLQQPVRGTMLFDGERFGVLFCGAPDLVEQALLDITADPRQAGPLVLVDADQVPPWALKSWHSGWCEPDALVPLHAPDAPQGPAAIETWRALMAASDLL